MMKLLLLLGLVATSLARDMRGGSKPKLDLEALSQMSDEELTALFEEQAAKKVEKVLADLEKFEAGEAPSGKRPPPEGALDMAALSQMSEEELEAYFEQKAEEKFQDLMQKLDDYEAGVTPPPRTGGSSGPAKRNMGKPKPKPKMDLAALSQMSEEELVAMFEEKAEAKVDNILADLEKYAAGEAPSGMRLPEGALDLEALSGMSEAELEAYFEQKAEEKFDQLMQKLADYEAGVTPPPKSGGSSAGAGPAKRRMGKPQGKPSRKPKVDLAALSQMSEEELEALFEQKATEKMEKILADLEKFEAGEDLSGKRPAPEGAVDLEALSQMSEEELVAFFEQKAEEKFDAMMQKLADYEAGVTPPPKSGGSSAAGPAKRQMGGKPKMDLAALSQMSEAEMVAFFEAEAMKKVNEIVAMLTKIAETGTMPPPPMGGGSSSRDMDITPEELALMSEEDIIAFVEEVVREYLEELVEKFEDMSNQSA